MRISDWSSDVCSSEDLPDPDRPVITVSLSRGRSSETFFRLCVRAPRMRMVSIRGGLGPEKGERDNIWVRHRSEEHTSELQSLMRISYAAFCLKKKIIYMNTSVHT